MRTLRTFSSIVLLLLAISNQVARAQDELEVWPFSAYAGTFRAPIFSASPQLSGIPSSATGGLGSIIADTTTLYYKHTSSSWFDLLFGTAGYPRYGIATDMTFFDQGPYFSVDSVGPALNQLAQQIADITSTVVVINDVEGAEAILGGYADFRIAHYFNTQNVLISVYRLSDNAEVYPLKWAEDASHVRIQFGRAVPLATYKAIILKSEGGTRTTETGTTFTYNHSFRVFS